MKRNIIAAGIAMSLFLAACENTAPDSGTVTISSVTSSESVLSETETVTEAVSEETEISSETDISTDISEETGSSGEIAVSEITEALDLKAYITEEFESAAPLSYETVEMSDISEVDGEAVTIAANAVKESEFYASAVRQAREMLVYENGSHRAAEGCENYFLMKYYLDFFNGEGSSEFAFEPKALCGAAMAFDGENTEYVIVFEMPLSYDFLEWSGTGVFYVSVYVNSCGEVFLLDGACNQTVPVDPLLIKYSDNRIHYCFQMGHTDGTSRISVYSFENGRPKLDFLMYGGARLESGSSLLRCENYFGWGHTLFRDGERDCYCIMDGAKAAPGLKEYLQNITAVTEKYPAITDPETDVWIYGGRFIAIEGIGFELDGDKITEYGVFMSPSEDTPLPVINADISNIR